MNRSWYTKTIHENETLTTCYMRVNIRGDSVVHWTLKSYLSFQFDLHNASTSSLKLYFWAGKVPHKARHNAGHLLVSQCCMDMYKQMYFILVHILFICLSYPLIQKCTRIYTSELYYTLHYAISPDSYARFQTSFLRSSWAKTVHGSLYETFYHCLIYGWTGI